MVPPRYSAQQLAEALVGPRGLSVARLPALLEPPKGAQDLRYEVLFETEEPELLEALVPALAVEDTWVMRMGLPDLQLRLMFDAPTDPATLERGAISHPGQRTELVELYVPDGELSYSSWTAPLVDQRALQAWFHCAGLGETVWPTDEQTARQRSTHADLARRREATFRAAAPRCLRLEADAPLPPVETLRGRLEAGLPDDTERAVALLRWGAHGDSDGDERERMPWVLLGEAPIALLRAAIGSEPYDETVVEGIARYLGQTRFSKARRKQLRFLPDRLKNAVDLTARALSPGLALRVNRLLY